MRDACVAKKRYGRPVSGSPALINWLAWKLFYSFFPFCSSMRIGLYPPIVLKYNIMSR